MIFERFENNLVRRELIMINLDIVWNIGLTRFSAFIKKQFLCGICENFLVIIVQITYGGVGLDETHLELK